MTNQLSAENMGQIIHGMVEGMSLRAMSRKERGNSKRTKKTCLNTVYKLKRDGGDAAIHFLNLKMRRLPCEFLELDELWAWAGIHPRTLRLRGFPIPGKGVFWIWVAIDPVSKLVVWWHIGSRKEPDCQEFVNQVAARCDNRLQITTDSLSSYEDAINEAWGGEVDYATVKKWDDEGEKLKAKIAGKPEPKAPKGKKSPPEKKIGNPDLAVATTNHIETFFQKFRQNLARLHRRGTQFSKTKEDLNRAVALYVWYYNFARVHETIGTTPAIAAGIDDEVWTMENFVELIIELRAERRAKKKVLKEAVVDATEKPTIPPDGEQVEGFEASSHAANDVSLPYCAFHNLVGKHIRIHRSDCAHLQRSPDRVGIKGLGVKYYCETHEEAVALGASLGRDRVDDCKVCLGRYQILPPGRGGR